MSEFLIYPHKFRTYNFLPTGVAARVSAIAAVLAAGGEVSNVYDVDISAGVILSDFADTFVLKAFVPTSVTEADAVLDVSSITYTVTATNVIPDNVFLYREIYDAFSETISRIELPLTLITETVPLQRSDHVNIMEFIYDSGGNSHSLRLSNLSLDPGYTYVLKFIGVTAGSHTLPDNGADGGYEVRLFVTSSTETEESSELSASPNNIYYKMTQLGRLIDIDNILNDSQVFDFQYEPVYWSAPDDAYRPSMDSEFNPITLRFETSKTVERLFIKEYLWEFEDYFNDMKDSGKLNTEASLIPREELTKLKSIIFRNSTLINTFKGTQDGIKFLHGMYSSSLGYTLISVDPDPYYNFVYSITATLPKAMWESSVKPIVHPLGWGIRYVYIDIDPNLPYIDTGDPMLKFLILFHKYRSYLDAFNESRMNVLTSDFVNIVPVVDTQSHRKFNFKESGYIAALLDEELGGDEELDLSHNSYYLTTMGPPTGYNSRGLATVIQDPLKFSFTVEGLETVNSTFSSSVEGVGSKYLWKLFRRNHLIHTLETSVPKFRLSHKWLSSSSSSVDRYVNEGFVLPDYMVSPANYSSVSVNWEERLRVQLILKRDDWTALSHEFFTDEYKKKEAKLKRPRISYSPMDEPAHVPDVMNLDLYETNLLDDLRSFNDPREYAGYLCDYYLEDPALVPLYLDGAHNWTVAAGPTSVKMTFNLPGIGLKYGWQIAINGGPINSFVQSYPTFTQPISPGDVITTVILTLYNGTYDIVDETWSWSYTPTLNI